MVVEDNLIPLLVSSPFSASLSSLVVSDNYSLSLGGNISIFSTFSWAMSLEEDGNWYNIKQTNKKKTGNCGRFLARNQEVQCMRGDSA